jgi:hypothetical protein
MTIWMPQTRKLWTRELKAKTLVAVELDRALFLSSSIPHPTNPATAECKAQCLTRMRAVASAILSYQIQVRSSA